jgi:hypothetical protein
MGKGKSKHIVFFFSKELIDIILDKSLFVIIGSISRENDWHLARSACPAPILLCSPTFRNMVTEEKLKGFDFEVAHIVEE